MSNNKISVIVPIYNNEFFLNMCIRSIINQNYTNLEIILVNDGSTDRSLDICKKYAAEDKRIIIVDKENGGVSSARNKGLDIATGDYIGFVDSDDYISCEMYEKLYSAMVSSDADIAECGYFTAKPDYQITNENPLKEEVILGNYECSYNYLTKNNTTNFNVNKLYRRSILENTRYLELKYSEDYAFNVMAFYNCQKKVTIKGCYYYYVQNPNSTCNKGFNEDKFDILKSGKEAYKFHESRFPQLNKYIVLYMLNNIRELYKELIDSNVLDKTKHKKRLIEEYKQLFPLIETELYQTLKFNKTYIALQLFKMSPYLYYLIEKTREGFKKYLS